MRNTEAARQTPLFGIVMAAAAFAVIVTSSLALWLHLSVLSMLMIYSWVGAAAVLFMSWRRYQSGRANDDTGQWGEPARHDYIFAGASRRR